VAKKYFPADLLEQLITIQDAWTRIDSKLTFGTLNLAMLTADIDNLRKIETSMVSLENQMTDLRNQREALKQTSWDKAKRARASVKGIYGDDSTQYELMGGTRLSDRKPHRRTRTSGS
jgi:hypothetical protein